MKTFAILGAGICGIALGNVLKEAYPDARVTIYSESTQDIVSYVAASQFYPIWVGDHLPVGFDRQLKKWFLRSKQEFSARAGARYGIRHHRNHELFKSEEVPPAYFHDVLSNFESVADPTLPLDYTHRFSFDTLIIDPFVYLPRLTQDFLDKGGRIVSKRFAALRDVLLLDEPIVFNCLGLGTRAIFDDPHMKPVKGVILRMKPLPELDVVVSANEHIIAPREHDLYIGCIYSEDWTNPLATAAERDYLFDSIRAIMETPGSIFALPQGTLQKKNIIDSRVGFRPFRETGPRVEKQLVAGKQLIHNYGHGGNGFILSWGTAYEALSLAAV